MNHSNSTGLWMPFASLGLKPLPRLVPWLRMGRGNTRTQKTVRREVRRRSNLPRAIQKRLGFKCH